MRIGIDISQLAYQNTGVATFLKHFVESIIAESSEHEFILFYSSLRKEFPISNFQFPINDQMIKSKITIKKFRIPPSILDILWNRLHIVPIENLIGEVDVFITSDWTEPPVTRAKKATILYDLIVYKYPKETAKKIIAVQKRKLQWVKKETDIIFCISQATKKDAIEILGIKEEKLKVTYPGL